MEKLMLAGLQMIKENWLLAIVILFVTLTCWHYTQNFTEIKRLGLPGPTPWPLLGNMVQLLSERKGMHMYYSKAAKKYGNVFGLYFLRQPCIVITDPEILRSVLVKDFNKFHDRPDFGLELPEPWKSVLTRLKGQRWKNIRSTISPAFTSGNLKQVIFIFNEAIETLLEKMAKAADEKIPVNMYEWQQNLTMEIILSSAFGVKSESQTNPEDKTAAEAKKILNPKRLLFLVSTIPLVGRTLSRMLMTTKYGFPLEGLISVARKIVKQRQEINGIQNQRKDMLRLMMAAQQPEHKGHKLTDNELIGQMTFFILAGYETTSTVLALTMYHLAVLPEVQGKLVEEINSICKSAENVSYEELQRMPYLEAVINETQRIYPPGYILTREVTESCTIKGIHFKKGITVLAPVYTLHHDEKYWTQPEEFIPERFLPGNKEHITPFTYLPFGDGPRNCIGLRFAMLEMKATLVRVLQKYRIVRGPETHVPVLMKPKQLLSPVEPILLRIERRVGKE